MVFDLHFFVLGQALEVRDVQVSLVNGLLCTMLPNMRSQDLPARCENDVRASVVRLQLLASILIDIHAHFFAFKHFDVTL